MGRIFESSMLIFNDENCAKYNNERQMSRKEYVDSVNAIEKFIKYKLRRKKYRKKRQKSSEQSGLISEIHQIQYKLLKDTCDTQHYTKYLSSIDKVPKGLDALHENLLKASAFMLVKYPEVLKLHQTLCCFKQQFSRYELSCEDYRVNRQKFMERAEEVQEKAERNLQVIKVCKNLRGLSINNVISEGVLQNLTNKGEGQDEQCLVVFVTGRRGEFSHGVLWTVPSRDVHK